MQFAWISVRLIASLDALAHQAGSMHVGLLIGSQALAPVFLAMVCGRWIDRVGVQKPVLVGGGVMLLGMLFPCLLPTADFGLWPVYACCFLIGLGYMFIIIDTQQLIGYVAEPRKRTGAFAWLALGFSTTGLVSPLVAGFIIDHANHRIAYIVALAVLCVGFGYFLCVRRLIPTVWDKEPVQRQKGHPFELMGIPEVRNMLIVSAFISMAWDLQHFMFPVYGHAIGLSASEIGLMVSVFFSATFLVRIVLPMLSEHITEWQFLTIVLVLSGVSYAVFPYFDSLTPLLVISFVLGLGLGCAQPNIMSLVHRVTPHGRVGEALGIRTMIINANHTALPTLFGFLTAAVGVASIFFSMAGLLALSSFLCMANVRREKNASTD